MRMFYLTLCHLETCTGSRNRIIENAMSFFLAKLFFGVEDTTFLVFWKRPRQYEQKSVYQIRDPISVQPFFFVFVYLWATAASTIVRECFRWVSLSLASTWRWVCIFVVAVVVLSHSPTPSLAVCRRWWWWRWLPIRNPFRHERAWWAPRGSLPRITIRLWFFTAEIFRELGFNM